MAPFANNNNIITLAPRAAEGPIKIGPTTLGDDPRPQRSTDIILVTLVCIAALITIGVILTCLRRRSLRNKRARRERDEEIALEQVTRAGGQAQHHRHHQERATGRPDRA